MARRHVLYGAERLPMERRDPLWSEATLHMERSDPPWSEATPYMERSDSNHVTAVTITMGGTGGGIDITFFPNQACLGVLTVRKEISEHWSGEPVPPAWGTGSPR